MRPNVRTSPSLRSVPPSSVFTGWDFSTGGTKCLAFDMEGNTLTEARVPTDLWTEGGVSELNLMQLEGQAHAVTRAIAARLRDLGRLGDWVAGGISATHHTAGRIDHDHVQVRRAICWNDNSLARYYAAGLKRLGGPDVVKKLIGGPWAIRYSLSHLVKDESQLPLEQWLRTERILPHGSLAAGYLTANFEVASVSAAASTGIMDLRSNRWRRRMLDAIADRKLRALAWKQLPIIQEWYEPVGAISESMAAEIGLPRGTRPLIFPTSDDQQAGLAGGGAVEPGHLAIILGNSAVVNSSSNRLPASDSLDAMKLSWGPYLWMRCYNNGAQFIDQVVGATPDWERLEREARILPAGTGGTTVLPFTQPEPSLNVKSPRLRWLPADPRSPGKRYRAALEALAYLIGLGVREHERAGQQISRITVSGGLARSDLMCEILASVLGRALERLISDEGPALGAAAVARAGLETYVRRQARKVEPFTVADAVQRMVRFRNPASPNPAWQTLYQNGVRQFEKQLKLNP